MWIFLFHVSFSIAALFLLVLSFLTAAGFAAMGYFINEYFDIADDQKAGKENKLLWLSNCQKGFLFLGTLVITITPWFWLPYNVISCVLFALQLVLYFLYAAPPFRLKNNIVWAGVIDALYAYVVPLTLSFVTFFLSGKSPIYYPALLFCFCVLFLIAGYRNLIIHHINDAESDKKLNKKTLLTLYGIERTQSLLLIAVKVEFVSIALICFLFYTLVPNSVVLFSLTLIALVLLIISKLNTTPKLDFIVLPNTLYQFYLPLITLINLVICVHWYWIVWLPIHLTLLIPLFRYHPIISWWQRQKIVFHRFKINIRQIASWVINYSLYFLFLLIGVNLKKRKLSAKGYIKTKLKWIS